MKNITIVYVLACLLLSCANRRVQSTAAAGPDVADTAFSLRVLCYNIHHANPPSKPGVIDIGAIVRVINAQQPALVALQEVDVHNNRSGKTLHEAAEIARQTGMPYYFFGKGIDYEGGEYGVAILSKYPMEKMTNYPLPTAEYTKGEHRTLATALISLPNNKKIIFASTHLDAQRTDTNRFLQVRKIVELLEKQQDYPVVIAGDFNAVPSSRVIKELDKHFTRSCISDCAFTIPQINPNKIIDYIAYRPAGKFTVTEHKVIDEQYASDHLPVLAVFKMNP